MNTNEFPKSNREVSDEQRVLFFSRLAMSHIPEMRLLFRGGKLWETSGWRNVVEHSLVQVAISEELAELLDLNEEETRKITTAALCHDWAKRLEIKPQEFSSEERNKAEEFLKKVKPDSQLMDATGEKFHERALLKGEATFLEKLQFYIDDICKGSEIVPFDERIDAVEAKRQDLNSAAEYLKLFGARYWDNERKLGHAVEEEVFLKLKGRGYNIASPKDIPKFIEQRINRKIESNA